MSTAMTLEEPLQSLGYGVVGPYVYESAGAAAIDHTASPGRPCYFREVFMTLAAGVAAENMVVDIIDAAGVTVATVETQAMLGLTSWHHQFTYPVSMASGWHVKFTQANGNTVAWTLKATFSDTP